MRVTFCGSGEFAVPSLQAILAGPHEVAGVITQPARPAGRGGKMHPTPVFQASTQAGLAPVECPRINDPSVMELLRQQRPDVIVVADFGQMVRGAVRSVAPLGAFNLHGSLLPELRGAAPINWAIIRGYRQTGATTFSLVDEMDAGAIYLQASLDINPRETAEELKARLAALGAGLTIQTLDGLANGSLQPQEQDHNQKTLAPRLRKEDGIIDWSAGAMTICDRIRGVWPWPAGQTVFRRKDGKETPVALARAVVESGGAEAGVLDGDLLVGAGKGGRVRILELKPAGRRLMSWRDFVNGHRVTHGDSFHTPLIAQ